MSEQLWGVQWLQNIPYREGSITSLMSLDCELLDQIGFDTGLEHTGQDRVAILKKAQRVQFAPAS